jgi:hypothetical protein
VRSGTPRVELVVCCSGKCVLIGPPFSPIQSQDARPVIRTGAVQVSEAGRTWVERVVTGLVRFHRSRDCIRVLAVGDLAFALSTSRSRWLARRGTSRVIEMSLKAAAEPEPAGSQKRSSGQVRGCALRAARGGWSGVVSSPSCASRSLARVVLLVRSASARRRDRARAMPLVSGGSRFRWGECPGR